MYRISQDTHTGNNISRVDILS